MNYNNTNYENTNYENTNYENTITKIRITKVQIKKIQIRKNKRKNCMIHFIFRFSIFAPELSKSVQNFCKTVFFVLILASQN